MAFDIKTFTTRAGSAAVFAIIMLPAFLGHEGLFFLLFAILTAVGLYEYQRLQAAIYQNNFTLLEKIFYLFIGVCLYVNIYFMQATVLKIGYLELHSNYFFLQFTIALLLAYFALGSFFTKIKMATGWAYIAVSFGLLGQLYHLHHLLPLIVLLLIWSNDTMQYLVGSFIGKTPMAPTISPKKTWEGTIGGSACAVVLACIWGYFNPTFLFFHWLCIGILVATAGTLGDLVESKLKRAAGVKDSGNIMPGHGGVLDRFDSILLAGPLVWLYAKLFIAF